MSRFHTPGGRSFGYLNLTAIDGLRVTTPLWEVLTMSEYIHVLGLVLLTFVVIILVAIIIFAAVMAYLTMRDMWGKGEKE